MSNNVRNIKNAVSNTVSVATTSVDVSTELVSDVSKLAVGTVRGFMPIVKALGGFTATCVITMANSQATRQEVEIIKNNVSTESIAALIESAAYPMVHAMIDDDEDTVTEADQLKVALARIQELEAAAAA